MRSLRSGPHAAALVALGTGFSPAHAAAADSAPKAGALWVRHFSLLQKVCSLPPPLETGAAKTGSKPCHRLYPRCYTRARCRVAWFGKSPGDASAAGSAVQREIVWYNRSVCVLQLVLAGRYGGFTHPLRLKRRVLSCTKRLRQWRSLCVVSFSTRSQAGRLPRRWHQRSAGVVCRYGVCLSSSRRCKVHNLDTEGCFDRGLQKADIYRLHCVVVLPWHCVSALAPGRSISAEELTIKQQLAAQNLQGLSRLRGSLGFAVRAHLPVACSALHDAACSKARRGCAWLDNTTLRAASSIFIEYLLLHACHERSGCVAGFS